MVRRALQQSNGAAAFALAASLSLAACGGVEIESKLLENIGVGGLIGNGKHTEQKLETRSALVVPPSTEQLPTPGTGTAASTATTLDPSFPQNPEAVAAAQKRAAEAKRKEECNPSSGKYGSRQSGPLSDQEVSSKSAKTDCSSPLKDLLGNSL